jgi:hypothetical protein
MLHILKSNQIIRLYITHSHLNLITIQLDPSKKISSSYNLDSSPDKIARKLEKKNLPRVPTGSRPGSRAGLAWPNRTQASLVKRFF